MLEKEKYDYQNKEHVKAICELHRELLPDSLIHKLGDLFMSKFYYNKLPKDKLIDVFLYKWNGKYISFTSSTNKPFTFLETAKKKYFFLILFILFISIIRKPSRIKIVPLPGRFGHTDDILLEKNLKKLKEEYGDKMGEFISFGVLKEYREKIDPQSQLQIPQIVVRDIFAHFREQKKTCFLGIVLKKNVNSLKFFEKFGIGYLFEESEMKESVIIKFYARENQI